MPELPEVETIREQLEKYLVGHKIEDIQVKTLKIFSGEIKKALGTRILGTRRFAKVLVIDLSNGNSIIAHVKLTGQFIYRGPNLKKAPLLSNKVVGGVPGKHTHVIFKLDHGGVLYYNDVRRFGWIRIVKTFEVENEPFIKKLGPEPFKGLSLKVFREILSKSGRPVKIVLMDQTKIGGVGNIYANDALWLAKVNPKRPAKELQRDRVTKLFEAILTVLKAGIKYGGSSELAYVTPDGAEGEYQKHTLAYGHEGDICKRCKKGKFKKFFLAGRGTYVCPICQK